MGRRNSLAMQRWCTVGVILLMGLCSPQLSAAPQEPRPNVVLILADDLGWTDLACYGRDFYETPHIDRLARDGMMFKQAITRETVNMWRLVEIAAVARQI